MAPAQFSQLDDISETLLVAGLFYYILQGSAKRTVHFLPAVLEQSQPFNIDSTNINVSQLLAILFEH